MTNKPRNEAIQELERYCQINGVFILDHHMFSNLSIAVQVEGNVRNVLEVARVMARNSFRAENEVQAKLELMEKSDPGSKFNGTIQVSFMSEDGNLEITVPMVPG